MPDGQIVAPARSAIRLADYTKPVFLVEEVSLAFDLDPQATIVRAALKLRRQGAGPLKLDGKALELLGVKLNGEALGGNRYTLTPDALTIAEVPDEFTLETEVKIAPDKNTELSGLYISGAGFFHAM